MTYMLSFYCGGGMCGNCTFPSLPQLYDYARKQGMTRGSVFVYDSNKNAGMPGVFELLHLYDL